jgi:hypothetical protein
MKFRRLLAVRANKCIHNFSGGRMSWKEIICKTKKGLQDNIKIFLGVIGYQNVKWSELDQLL